MVGSILNDTSRQLLELSLKDHGILDPAVRERTERGYFEIEIDSHEYCLTCRRTKEEIKELVASDGKKKFLYCSRWYARSPTFIRS